ncbi:MAG: type II toxin-antitoxin system VapC family toxin [Chloroflexota bacterium]|nr:type II toxin-antitoxin system VapC family toxin [Chloroflexota bacterium]
MIVDSSVILAILQDEPEGPACLLAVGRAPIVRLSAASFFEAALVIDAKRNPIATRRFDDFIRSSAAIIEPVTETQARIAREAYRDFGKGSGHPARLNFGDCFAYALAKDQDEPLLFIGQDFVHTDIGRVLN